MPGHARRPDIKRQEEFMSREDLEALGREAASVGAEVLKRPGGSWLRSYGAILKTVPKL